MTNTDIINIVLSSIVALTAVISIVIAIITMKKNSKMIEDSTRPNIVIYSSRIDTTTYIIIKNFGATTATIDEFKCDRVLERDVIGVDGDVFSKLKNSIIAPSQSIRCPILAFKLKDFDFKFHIKYHSTTHSYKDDFNFNLIANDPFANMNSSKKDEVTALQNIYVTLLEILKRKL